ncbi:hypothetical protein IAE22_28950, partial [Bacillus sp. S34]|nr:hypothetical protein [Bacillus sp. S34]
DKGYAACLADRSSVLTREQIAEVLDRASDEGQEAEANWRELMLIMADAVIASITDAAGHTKAASIAALTPGTTFTAELSTSRRTRRWMLLEDAGLLHRRVVSHNGEHWTASLIDESTIRDVQPPASGVSA